jgi:DNA-binding NtrC family response regulator
MAMFSKELNRRHFGLVVSGEARRHAENLRKLLQPHLVDTLGVSNVTELLLVVQQGQVDAAVIDSDQGDQDVLKMLRMVRRVNAGLPVVLVIGQANRRFLEGALRLEAFSILHKPVEREDLLIQLRRIVERQQLRRQRGVQNEQ